MGFTIGIDFGLHNCRVAVCTLRNAKILDNRENKPETPSIVGPKRSKHKRSDDKDETYIGDMALDNWENAPGNTILSVRRLIGRSITDPEVEKVRKSFLYKVVEPADGTKDGVHVVMNGKQYSPVEISAMIFRKLKEDAEHRIGGEEKVTRAVVTVPSYFSQIQREAIREAANLAGLKVLRILNEPIAAAIALGLYSESGEVPKKILVYDLSGGTCDISLLMWDGSNFLQLNTEGDMWLGGNDFDQVIINKAIEHIRTEYGIDARKYESFMSRLKKKAKAVKERLSAVNSTELIVTGLRSESGDIIDVDMEITRQEFEQMIRPMVDETIKLTQKALAEAQLTNEDIDYVLLTGGSVRIPLIQQILGNMFGEEKIRCSCWPERSIAIGAAIVAATMNRVICHYCETANAINAVNCSGCGKPFQFDGKPDALEDEVFKGDGSIEIVLGAPFSYGIQSEGDRFDLFIQQYDLFPTPVDKIRTFLFYTVVPNQRTIRIPIYGGNNLEKASANEKQGEGFTVLPPGLPKGTIVLIKIWLDENCIFGLSAHLENGKFLRPWIIHGELDHKAVQEFDVLQEELNKWEKDAMPEQSKKIEKTVSDAYGLLEERRIEDAIRLVKQVLEDFKQDLGEADWSDSI